MLEAGMPKSEIRAAARTLGLANWNKPSFACLSSRIPHGTPVTVAALRQIEAAETAVPSQDTRGVSAAVPAERFTADLVRLPLGRDLTP